MKNGPPPRKIEYAIVCDDVRREDNGKLIIIGAYASDIRVPSYPANLRLNILVAVRSETEHQVSVSIRVMRDGERILEMNRGLEITIPAQDISLFSISGLLVSAEKDATLDFQVRFDKGRYRSACKIKMRKKLS